MRGYGRRTVRAALASAAVVLLLAAVADRWYVGEMNRVERARVRERMLPYANSLRSAIDLRFGVLTGFHAFASTRRTRADLEAEMEVFARGAVATASGVRALQYYDDGRIVRIEPLGPNRGALGIDLARDPNPRVREDYRRSLESVAPTVTGPVPLAEGGMGILLRQRLAERAGFPQIVAVVLDAPSIVRDAGIPDAASGLRLEVLSARGVRMGGDTLDAAREPVEVPVTFEGDEWTLRAAPVGGWQGAMREWHWTFRGLLGLVVLLTGLVVLTTGDRLERLAHERAQSDSTLRVAMRVGRIGAWSYEFETGHVETSGATMALLGEEGAPPQDLVVRFLDMLPPEDRGRVERLVEEMRTGARDTFATEFRLVRAGGSLRSVVALGQVVRDAADRPHQLVGVLTDVSERRALEERLRQSERLESVGKLAGGVAHDFNNLLTAIGGFAELAAGHVAALPGPAAAEIAADLAEVVRSTREGARLTSQLLAFSRRAPAEPSRVDLALALADLQPILGRLFGEFLDPSLGIAPDLPPVRAEPAMLTQVLLSLLVRARDATPGPRVVRLRAFHVPATSGRRPVDAPVGEWVCLEMVEEGRRPRATPGRQMRRHTPANTTALLAEPELGAVGLAVIASGIESGGGRLVTETRADGTVVTHLFVPPWTAPA